jgi:hypothetical protein
MAPPAVRANCRATLAAGIGIDLAAVPTADLSRIFGEGYRAMRLCQTPSDGDFPIYAPCPTFLPGQRPADATLGDPRSVRDEPTLPTSRTRKKEQI